MQLTAYFQRGILNLLCLINKNKSVTFNKIHNLLFYSILNVNNYFFINNINSNLPTYIWEWNDCPLLPFVFSSWVRL